MRRTLAPLCLSLRARRLWRHREAPVEYEQPFTSDVATLLDFEFDGELTASSGDAT